MLHDFKMAFIVTRREVRDQFRDWRIIFPILVLTIFFPGLMNFTASRIVNFVEQYGAPIIGERLIPFMLMVVGFFPISVSLVIALESFVGEKERRSIEPLLSSPLSNSQLYFGKLMAAMIPPLIAAYLGIAVYLAGIYRQVGWSPEPIFLIQILLLTTVTAVLMVSGAVVVSSQTTSVRAANLLASFIIVPMALLLQGESVVMFWGQYDILWWIIAALAMIAGLLVRTGLAYFNREELLGRELDMLNMVWAWRIFRSSFLGNARSPLGWYRHQVLPALKNIRMPLVFATLAIAFGIFVGIIEAREFTIPPELIQFNQLNEGFIEGLESLSFFSASGVGVIWLHNLRVVAIASVLGIFSFGVLGIFGINATFDAHRLYRRKYCRRRLFGIHLLHRAGTPSWDIRNPSNYPYRRRCAQSWWHPGNPRPGKNDRRSVVGGPRKLGKNYRRSGPPPFPDSCICGGLHHPTNRGPTSR